MQGGVWAAQLLTSAFECLSPESQKMSGRDERSAESSSKSELSRDVRLRSATLCLNFFAA